jgi:hypothetical protein
VRSADVAKLFFTAVYVICRGRRLNERPALYGRRTLIEAWANLTCFLRKDGKDQVRIASAKADDSGNPTIDFSGSRGVP